LNQRQKCAPSEKPQSAAILATGLVLEAFVAGFIGPALSAAGYSAGLFRAGIEAVHKGQREAHFRSV